MHVECIVAWLEQCTPVALCHTILILSDRNRRCQHAYKLRLHRCAQEIALYLDFRLDESYTPKQISVRAGDSFTDMVEIHAQELEEPSGWTRIKLQTTNSLQGMLQCTSKLRKSTHFSVVQCSS